MFVRPWLKLIIGVSYQYSNFLQSTDQCIIVANHNSHFDTLAIMAALRNKQLKNTQAVAAADYFNRNWIVRALLDLFFNAVLIQRNGPSTLSQLDRELKNGRSLIMFPEGTRGKPGVISNFKKGIAYLLEKNPNVPIIPVYLDGFGRVLPKDTLLIVPLICKIRFGEHFHPGSHELDTITEEVKKQIMDLKAKDQWDRNQFEIKTENEISYTI